MGRSYSQKEQYMVAKSISLSCPECGSEYTIVTSNWESIAFCPICGDAMPYDDVAKKMDDDEEDEIIEDFGDDVEDEL